MNNRYQTKIKGRFLKIKAPVSDNPLINQALVVVNQNPEINMLWRISNTNAIERLKMTDHGPVHFQIVTNVALKIMRLLREKKVKMTITENYGLSYEYAELVVLLTCLFHDLGMTINREGHEEYSLFLANNLMRETLTFLPVEERTVVIAETLHAIINHRSDGQPLTIEAGVVRVADALDMSEGRSRIPYETGKMNIYSLSALAVDKVEIKPGKDKPILIVVYMNNSSGLFQVDELLKKKIKRSGLEKLIEVEAFISHEKEKKLMKGKFKISY